MALISGVHEIFRAELDAASSNQRNLLGAETRPASDVTGRLNEARKREDAHEASHHDEFSD